MGLHLQWHHYICIKRMTRDILKMASSHLPSDRCRKKTLSPPNHLLKVVSLRKAFLLPTDHTYPLDVLEPLLFHYLVWISLFSVLRKSCLCAFPYWLCVEWGFFVSFVFVIYSKILGQKKTKRSKYGKNLKSRWWIHKGVFMIPFSQLFYIFESFNNNF